MNQQELNELADKIMAYEFIKPINQNPMFEMMYNAQKQAQIVLADMVRGNR